MKSKPGITIIASYFLFNGSYVAYQLVIAVLHGGITESNLFYNLIPIVFLTSGVGLFLKKGWGWNLTVLAAGCYLLLGVLKAAAYLAQQNDISLLIKGGVDILMALCIIGYMNRKTIKEGFEKSPISLMCIGTFLLLSGVSHMFAIQILDTIFRMIALLVGMVVLFKAKQQLREQGDSTTLGYSTPYEANMVKSQLESAGIPAFIADEYTIGMNWLYSDALGGVKVQVPESQASEALQILAPETEPSATCQADAEICPKCGSKNTENFLDKRSTFLTWALLGLPLLLPTEKKRCNDCGHRWRPSK